MLFAQVVKTENGFAIELLNNIGEHVSWFKRSDGSIKTWQRIEGAEKVIEKSTNWYVF